MEKEPNLSVLIPARNEIYLEKTIRNVLENAQGDIEVLVALDGYLPDPPFDVQDDRVKFFPIKEAVGHRAATNLVAKEAKGKFVMKLDAHCAVGPGFDVILAADCEYDWTVIPRMLNIDIQTFKPRYFGDFDKALRQRKLHDYIYMGINAKNELRTEYYPNEINTKLHLDRKDILIDETLSNMGCCFFMHRDRYWELGGCDENHEGGWGSQGIEVALKAWLSGGKLVTNKKTWFAHWFRGDLGWPYPISGNQISRCRKYSKDLWMNNKWEGQKFPLCRTISKFSPVPGWTGDNLRLLKLAGRKFLSSSVKLSHVESVADLASSGIFSGSSGGEQVASNTVSSSSLLSTDTISPQNIDSMGSESQMSGVAAETVGTDVVNDRNISTEVSPQGTDKPSIHDSMDSNLGTSKSNSSVSKVISVPSPQPTSRLSINGYLLKDSDYCSGIEPFDEEELCTHCPLFRHKDKNLSIETNIDEVNLNEKEPHFGDYPTEEEKMFMYKKMYWHIIKRRNLVRWRGHIVLKFPSDMMLYQRAINDHKPDFIIETGTFKGGSAFFFADICELNGKGHVITIDPDNKPRPEHPRVTYLFGKSTEPEIVEKVKSMTEGKSVMVILDSDHSFENVSEELKTYAPFVTNGQFMVVEDCYGKFGEEDRALRARDAFLKDNKDFVLTDYDDRFLVGITMGGWLQKR